MFFFCLVFFELCFVSKPVGGVYCIATFVLFLLTKFATARFCQVTGTGASSSVHIKWNMSVGAEGKILITPSANMLLLLSDVLYWYINQIVLLENNLFVPVYLPCNRARSAGPLLWKELAVSRECVNSSGLPCFGGWCWYPKALAHTAHGQEHLRTLLVHTSIHICVWVLCLTTEDERK